MAVAVGRKQGARRAVRVVAGVAAVGLGATAIVAAGGGSAGAATINAQSVGRFLDGSAGSNPIQGLVDLKDARATAPGTTSEQNPLNITAFNAIKIPLTNAIKIPTSPALDAGAVNQVATANTNGKSLGAAGAVARDGGAQLSSSTGGSEPDTATINLTDAAFGNVGVPGLGGGSATPLPVIGNAGTPGALGGITGAIHAVYSRVSTAKGGEIQTPSSGVAGLTLSIGSPALAGVIKQFQAAFTTSALGPVIGNLVSISGCTLTNTATAADIPLASGAVTISPSTASIKIDIAPLLKLAGKDISDLSTSNFDLVSFLIKKLPDILSDGVAALITSTTTALGNQLKNCTGAAGQPLDDLVDQLLNGQGAVTDALKRVTAPLVSGSSSGLDQLASGLQNILDIGLNVQSGPGIEPQEQLYKYTSKLQATPNQATDVVENQTLVRAIEINVLSASAIPMTPTGGLVNVALANSAAGPSEPAAAAAASPSAAPTAIDNTAIPTGIPAGEASGIGDRGSPVLPIVAVLMLLAVSGAAFWQVRSHRGAGASHRG